MLAYPRQPGKGWVYEGGIREPWIVRWPGVTKPGSVSAAVITSPDLYPTILEVVRTEPRAGQHRDGVSFAAALRGETHARGPVFWHYPHYGNQGGAPAGAVRDGHMKLIEWFEDDRIELFDLASDPGEQRDLAADRPELAAKLRLALQQFRSDTKAVLPRPNTRFDPGG